MNTFTPPDWIPKLEPGTRLLITGATGGLGTALVDMALAGAPDCIIGAHGASRLFESVDSRVFPIQRRFETEADCRAAVDAFVEHAGGIDALVVLSGGIHFSGHWKDMPAEDWEKDIAVNLNQPFYLARRAMEVMRAQPGGGRPGGGRIVLTGTESALHGGSAQSFPYAAAKRGTEAMVQGLAREGAPHNVLVNGVRLGFIASGFHQRWHSRTEEDMKARAEMVPLKRGGDPQEAAALMLFLMSGWAQFMTGQMIPLTGGDWL
ncbi:MAG: SDR family NAD(P)-dependent oxidoreductase [Rhodospirillales bacterium]